MQVGDIMSTPVVTVGAEENLHAAVGTMLEHRVGSVVVTDPGPEGIVTRSDALRAAHHTEKPLTALAVSDVMTADIVTTTAPTAVETALRTMTEHNVKKLPVVDDLDMVGIITMTDIAQHLPERVREARTVLDRQDDWTA